MPACSTHIIDIISNTVGAVSNAILGDLHEANNDINSISFMYGSTNELIETIVQNDKSPDGKYNLWPSIMLFLDTSTQVSSQAGKYDEVTLQMAIVMPTDPTYKAAERYEYKFEPVLYPLWHEFVKQIVESGCFSVMSENTLEYTKWDRLYWGKQGNTLHMCCDAVQLENLKLRVIPGANPIIVEPAARFFNANFFDRNFFE